MERKGKPSTLMDEVKIIDREEHWRIRCFRETVHMLGYSDLLNRLSTKMNMTWESIIKKNGKIKNFNRN